MNENLKTFLILGIGLLLSTYSCKTKNDQTDCFDKAITEIKDTLNLSPDLKIINIYKEQLRAYHLYQQSKDSVKLKDDLAALYKRHPTLWGVDGCFNWSAEEFTDFNKDNAILHFESFKNKAEHLIEHNFDSVLSSVFMGVSQYSGFPVKGQYFAYFMPHDSEWFDMGGCDINTMQINLSNTRLDVEGIIEIFPHELNHQIYEVTSSQDPYFGTLLWGIIDEGFATYFEQLFNDSDTVSSLKMSEEDYQWCLAHEKEIYEKSKALFFSTDMEDEQKLRGNQGKFLIEGAPERLNYFLGYRIIQQYVKVHGSERWRDVYTTPVLEILEKSGYAEKFK